MNAKGTSNLNFLYLLFIISVFSFIKCGKSENRWQSDNGQMHGTFYNIVYSHDINLKKEIEYVMRQTDTSLSIFLENSIISRINKGDTDVKLDSLFIDVFDKGKEIYEITDGAFDITAATLINAWGFGSEKTDNNSTNAIKAIMAHVGYDKVLRQGDRIIIDDSVKLNVNAIAKGYSVDRVAQFLENNDIANYMVEIGGEVRVAGKNSQNKIWKIGIDKPENDNNITTNREVQAVLSIGEGAVATSGNYRQYYVKDGRCYSHIIDPKTGYPVQHNLLSVTVLAEDCITADAFATAFMVLGYEKSTEIINKLDYIEAYFILSETDKTYRIEYSKGFDQIIE